MSNSTSVQHPACEQLRTKAGELGENLKKIGSLAPEAAREQFHDIKAGAQECLQHTRAKVVDTQEGVEDFVRERPLQSVLIAAGAGVLIGLLLSRK